MTGPLTIQAVYRDGAIQLKTKLDLPNNTPLQVLIVPLAVDGKPSLFGAFPQLAALKFDDLMGIKQLLNDGLNF
jgi:hypothetical protein